MSDETGFSGGRVTSRLRIHILLFCLLSCVFGSTVSYADKSLQVHAQLGLYLKSAFARSKHLLKPKHTNLFVVRCSAKAKAKCSALTAGIKPFIPIDNLLQEDISDATSSPLELYVFLDRDDRRAHQIELAVGAGLRQAIYDDGNCAAMQFLDGYEVRKGLVVVLLSQGTRLSEACAMSQIGRISGLSFRQRFNELAPYISAMSESEFTDSKSTFRALLDYHYSPFLRAGMTESQVNSILKAD